jgi:tRNA pseudouridine synthase 10
MLLCRVCNAANGSRFAEGECYICGGAAPRLDGMVQKAVALLRAEGAATFSISSVIDKEWLSREEKAWDHGLEGAESIKNLLNRRISAEVEKRTGASYGPEGRARLVFDFGKNEVSLVRNNRFFFGRYMKIAAGLSQSRWKCAACDGKGCPRCQGKGRMYESVEERVGGPLKDALGAQDYVMHASGREDVDATNSAGRAFVMEVKAPKAAEPDLAAVAAAIASGGDVSVSGLREVPRAFVELVTESHFDKAYEAEAEFSRDVTDDDMLLIRSLEGRTLLQKTPARVAHRRADMVRHRKIKHVEAVRKEGQDARHISLVIKAEAGTYIKELISGDGGRTEPSVGGLLNAKAVCTRLEVISIDDGYLDFCLENYSGRA